MYLQTIRVCHLLCFFLYENHLPSHCHRNMFGAVLSHFVCSSMVSVLTCFIMCWIYIKKNGQSVWATLENVSLCIYYFFPFLNMSPLGHQASGCMIGLVSCDIIWLVLILADRWLCVMHLHYYIFPNIFLPRLCWQHKLCIFVLLMDQSHGEV